MKLDGSAVQYLLSRDFRKVTSEGISQAALFDYPVLYDISGGMSGHVVLVPAFERPGDDVQRVDLTGALCICVSSESVRSARDAGIPVVHVHDEVPFQSLYNYMQYLFVLNERLDAQLRAHVDAHAGFQLLLDACAKTWGYGCVLIDNQFRMVCSSQGEGAKRDADQLEEEDSTLLESELVDLFMASSGYRHMRGTRKMFTVPGSGNLLMKNVFHEGRLVGSLAVRSEDTMLSARFVRFLLQYLCPFVEEMYDRIGSFGLDLRGSSRVKAALESALEKTPGGYGVLEAALAEAGHDEQSVYQVIRIERSFTNEGTAERNYLAHRFERAWPRAYCFTWGADLFMLVDTTKVPEGTGGGFDYQLPVMARDNLVKVGASRLFDDVSGIDAACVQASAALEQGSRVDPTNWRYRFDDYALSWLMVRAVGNVPPEYVCHPAITVLKRHDAEHGTDYLATLSRFMHCRYNATATAEALFVARSTLIRRLDRIQELTGFDFDDAEQRLYLRLSLAMDE